MGVAITMESVKKARLLTAPDSFATTPGTTLMAQFMASTSAFGAKMGGH